MERRLLLFAPGAGAPSTSRWMEGWARRLSSLGEVVRFDYPYVKAGRRTPDRLPVLVAAHRAALAEARAGRDGPVVLAGKSMGSRVGCHAFPGPGPEVEAHVCFGYPLRGAQGAMRDAPLLALRVPVLFLTGSRDPLCPLDLLEAVRARMTARSALHVVDGGNHSLEVGARSLRERGETQAEVDARVLEAVRSFLSGI